MRCGDSISISGVDNLQNYDICDLKVAGIVKNISPYNIKNDQLRDYTTAIVIILSNDRLKQEIDDGTITTGGSSWCYISTSNPYKLDEKREEIEKLGGITENLYETRKKQESGNELIKGVIYIFDIMLNVFCMVNIFYIISASTIFRKKDFAVLRSIGMSEKQINKMMILEGLMYGFSGLIFGTIFSLIGLYLLGKYSIDGDLYLFKFPIIHIIYAIIIVYVVILFAMISAKRKVKNKNIIDNIRMNNI